MKKIILIFILASLSIFAQESLNYQYDDSGNRIEKSSNDESCDCFCPNSNERNSWLTLSVVTDAGCGPDKCKLTGTFQIPLEYACYTHYKIDDGTDQYFITGEFNIIFKKLENENHITRIKVKFENLDINVGEVKI